jgi:hypothetical protein
MKMKHECGFAAMKDEDTLRSFHSRAAASLKRRSREVIAAQRHH